MAHKLPRVLHVGSTAGVGAALAYHMGHDCMHRRSHDPYNSTGMYDCGYLVGGSHRGAAKLFMMRAAWRARQGADLLHVHVGHDVARTVSKWADKPYILHYHGTDVRGVPPHMRADTERKAKAVLVSPEYLLHETYAVEPVHIPNPIDTKLFHPYDIPQNNRGLAILTENQTERDTLERLE